MSMVKKIQHRAEKRAQRVRKAIKASGLVRISVFRSLNQIYGQVIDDNSQKTIVSCSSLELTGVAGDKKAIAKAVGVELAKRALSKGIERAAFDRGSFLYHGRVKALAEGLREGGLSL
ncbi:MAG: 50S ribosomal protein L18 [Candidatus Dependentiae bacterium ADurb.Bin331]|nr:MAG: 50S ribosomal protein L18 [Candidatus Dependentiae bacterium ADurb.Bin331]